MSRIGSTGNIKLFYLPSVADPDAPTLAEIAAGVNLTDYLLRDGLSRPKSGNTIDVAGAATKYNATDAGTYGGDAWTVSFFRDSEAADDDAWDTLPRGTRGWWLVLPFDGSDVAAAAGDRGECAEMVVISRSERDIEQDGAYRFDVSSGVPSEPEDDAVVAA